MSELQESAHGELTQVDKTWDAPRFLILLVATLIVAFIILFAISGWKHIDYEWPLFANDMAHVDL